MEYSKMHNIQTALPHFRDSFPSPSFLAPSQKTYIAPLSASSLQQYNNTQNNKRKAFQVEDEEQEDYSPEDSNKRMMMMMSRARVGSFGGPRQRQESGCSVTSTSSTWSSSSSFSNISTTSVASKSPSLSSSPSLSPVEMDESSSAIPAEFNPLWHLCDAIALISEPTPSRTATVQSKTVTHKSSSPKKDNSPYGLKIVFVAPNWLAEHMAKSKKAAAMKKLHSLA
ncbi:MAG: hypothetical protein J3R72DRAFT_437587 [Linnemannia gamsii]|nr:MAG: hypothetical protein J3R72DRAFT_437587 [Linnemannia gamsii]